MKYCKKIRKIEKKTTYVNLFQKRITIDFVVWHYYNLANEIQNFFKFNKKLKEN